MADYIPSYYRTIVRKSFVCPFACSCSTQTSIEYTVLHRFSVRGRKIRAFISSDCVITPLSPLATDTKL